MPIDATASSGAEVAWAEVHIGPLSSVRGEVIAFDGRVVRIAVRQGAADVPVLRPLSLTLGVGAEQAARVPATVVERRYDGGLACLHVELADPDGHSRRRHPRVPFNERIEAMAITDGPGPDIRFRGRAVDISLQGLGATLSEELKPGSHVLLRFVLPPRRDIFQVRANVRTSLRVDAHSFRTGFLFERMTPAHCELLEHGIVQLRVAAAVDRNQQR